MSSDKLAVIGISTTISLKHVDHIIEKLSEHIESAGSGLQQETAKRKKHSPLAVSIISSSYDFVIGRLVLSYFTMDAAIINVAVLQESY